MMGLAADVQLAVRALKRRPGYVAAVTGTLALGIGATVAVFSVVDVALLRPLPYPAPQELAVVVAELPQHDRLRAHVSGPELAALWERARSVASVGAVWARPGVFRSSDGPVEEVEVGWITPGFLETLGVKPHLGRWPTEAELSAERPEVLLMSFELWKRRYGGDPAILGRAIDFDDERYTVVGVMPPEFRMLFPPEDGVPESPAAWLPWGGDPSAYREMPSTFRVFTAVARLRGDVGRAAVADDLRQVADSVRAESLAYQASGLGLRAEALAEGVAAHVRPALMILSGVVAFVLLIACANVTNLSLARAADLDRDLAVRAALGASPQRLLRQVLAESAVLGALGASLGLFIAAWALEVLRVLEPGQLPRIDEVSLDGRAIAVALTSAFLAALVFGAASALRALHGASASALHLGSRGPAGAPSGLRGVLVVSQLALSLVLLVGAGLLVRSAARLAQVDPGFEPRGVVTSRLSLPDVRYRYRDQGGKIAEFYRRLEERVSQLPGVVAAGATLNPPLSGAPVRTSPYAWRTDEGDTDWGATAARYVTVTPGWFAAAKVRLLSGRFLDSRDDSDHPLAVVVDATLARRAWPEGQAVGRAIRVDAFRNGRFEPAWGEVVGVIQPLRLSRLDRPDGEQLYLAHAQAPQRTMFLTVRAAGDPRALLPAIQEEVGALEKDLPLFDVRLADEHVARATAVTRFAVATLSAFAGVAVALAATGVYAVIALSVRRRRQEIGVRLALGATRGRIAALVLGEGAVLAGAGVALGLLGASALTRLLDHLLFEVSATDPGTFVGVVLLLTLTTLAATLFPAWRASRVDPLVALREE
jgi:predicted permease